MSQHAESRECPRLRKAGIDEANAGYGVERNWIKEICNKCPYKKCVYDKKSKRKPPQVI